MTVLTTTLASPPALDSDAAIQNALKSHTTALLGFGILFLAVGTAAIVLPVLGTFLAETLLGGMMILSGFLYCGLSFQLRGFWNVVWMFIAGLLTIAAGLILWFYPTQSILTLTLFLSAYFIVTGVFKVQHRAISGWVWSLVSATASILLGGMVWWGFPETALWTLGLLFGIDLFFYGWTLITIRSAVTANPVSSTVTSL